MCSSYFLPISPFWSHRLLKSMMRGRRNLMCWQKDDPNRTLGALASTSAVIALFSGRNGLNRRLALPDASVVVCMGSLVNCARSGTGCLSCLQQSGHTPGVCAVGFQKEGAAP